MITLSADDLVRHAEATRKLLSPLTYANPKEWRADVAEAVRAFVGADAAMTGIPGAGAYLHSPDLSAEVLGGIQRYLEGPTLGSLASPDPDVNMFYRELQRRGGDAVDFGDVDRLTEGRLRESSVYTEVFEPAGLLDMLTLYVPIRTGGGPGFSALSLYSQKPSTHRAGIRRTARLRILRAAFESSVDTLARLGGARAMLDAVSSPLLAYGTDGRELHRTPALERLLGCDTGRVDVEAAASRLARGLATLSFPRRSQKVADPSRLSARRSVATGSGRYDLRATVVAEGPLGGDGALIVTVERVGSTVFPTVEAVRERHQLSPREAEVALLLAEGLSNGALAARLSISPYTARRHTESVLRKLLVESRAAVAARLVERDDALEP